MTTDIDAMRGLLEAIQNTASDETYFKPLDELTEQLPAILDELEAARAEIARLQKTLLAVSKESIALEKELARLG